MKKTPPKGLSRLFFSLVLLLFCGASGVALFFFSSSPASAAFFATLTPTQENLWAFVSVAKPAHTPAPVFIPTNTGLPTALPTSIPTEVPGAMDMQVLADTAVPAYAAQDYAQAPVGSSGGKYILVDISEQHMYVYNGDALLYSFVASTGIHNATRVGTFAVQSKIPNAYGSTWNIWMPNWLGIYWAGGLENGIHALPILPNGATLWEGYLGRPVSYGCVVLGTYESSLLYEWAEIGTTVEIRW
jgi:lipoprotein-anchoring transpeptidase ErfK/SrfK